MPISAQPEDSYLIAIIQMGDASIDAGERNVLRLGKLISQVGKVATLHGDLADVFGVSRNDTQEKAERAELEVGLVRKQGGYIKQFTGPDLESGSFDWLKAFKKMLVGYAFVCLRRKQS